MEASEDKLILRMITCEDCTQMAFRKTADAPNWCEEAVAQNQVSYGWTILKLFGVIGIQWAYGNVIKDYEAAFGTCGLFEK